MFASKHRKDELFPLVNRRVVQGCPDFQKVDVFKVYVPFSCPSDAEHGDNRDYIHHDRHDADNLILSDNMPTLELSMMQTT